MPERLNLTQKAIEKIPPPEKGRKNIYDQRVPRLVLRITANDVRTWYYVGRHKGKMEWVKLDRLENLTPEQARTAAQVYAGEFASGNNPAEQKREERSAWTFWKALDEYESDFERRNGSPPSNLESYRKNWFDRFKGKRLSEITTTQAERLQLDIGAKCRPGTVNRIIAVARAVVNHAMKRRESRFAGPNPFAHLSPFRVQPRKQRLYPQQLARFFVALESVSDDMRDVFSLCLWSGRRRGEVLSMRWQDVSLDTGLWLSPQTKSGEMQEVWLPAPAVKILKGRDQSGEFVFPSRGKAGHITETKKAWADVKKKAGLDDLRLHDLRRTLASMGQEMGFQAALMAAQLGNTAETTTAHYTQFASPAQKAMMDAIAKEMRKAAKTKKKKKKGASAGGK